MAFTLYKQPHDFIGTQGDMPTSEHDYRSHRLIPGNQANAYKWSIQAIGFSTHPRLKGLWTSVPMCERAIDDYWHIQEIVDKHISLKR